MVQSFTLNGEAVEFKSSAALPIVYDELTGGEFFGDFDAMNDNRSIQLKLVYVMYKHAHPEDTVSMVDWLSEYNLMEIISILPQLVRLVTATMQTKSEPKKNKGE